MNLNRLGNKRTIIRCLKWRFSRFCHRMENAWEKNNRREYLLSTYYVPGVLPKSLYRLILTPIGDQFYFYPHSKSCGLEEELA